MSTGLATPSSRSEKTPSSGAIVGGVGWTTFRTGAEAASGLVVQLILVRLLIPEHFGIVGMAAVFTGLVAVLNEKGLASALIHLRATRLKWIHYHTAFWVSVLTAVVLFILLSGVLGPFAVWLYGEPLLYWVIPILGLPVLLGPLAFVHKVQLTRHLRFKPLSLIEAGSKLVSGLAGVILALAGAGVWSLAWQGTIAAAVSVPAFWVATGWTPRFCFSRRALRHILGRGLYDISVRLTTYVTQNVDYLLIGKLLGSHALGIYTLAFLLTDVMRQKVMAILNQVMFPVYAKVQQDVRQVRGYYLTVVRYNTLMIVPVALGLFLFADPTIRWIFGEEWQEAVFPIQAMAIASALHSVGGTSHALLRGLGHFRLIFALSLIILVLVTVPSFVVGIYMWGINGAATAVVFHKLVSRVVHQQYLRKLVGVREGDILRAVLPAVSGTLGGLGAYGLTTILMPVEGYPSLILGGSLVVVGYLAACLVFVRKELWTLYQRAFGTARGCAIK